MVLFTVQRNRVLYNLTLADTCGGGVDLDSITLELCQRYVEEIVLLSESEIEESIRLLFEQHRLVVEGSGALGVGGLLKRRERFKGKKVVAVVCGRNVDLEVFKRIIRYAIGWENASVLAQSKIGRIRAIPSRISSSS